jgi:hypothetical protein
MIAFIVAFFVGSWLVLLAFVIVQGRMLKDAMSQIHKATVIIDILKKRLAETDGAKDASWPKGFAEEFCAEEDEMG